MARGFFPAGAMLSLLALPLVVTSVREGLQAIPNHVREASYAVGKTKIATIRRVLLPAVRPDIITGSMIGAGHAIGDTAIIVFLLGEPTRFRESGNVPMLGTLRGTGSTLTSFIFDNAPDRRPQSAQQGVRGGIDPARDRLDHQRHCRHIRSQSKGIEMDVITPPPPVRRLEPGATLTVRPPRPRRW